MNHPDAKKHQLISFGKSGIRILSSLLAVAGCLVGVPAVQAVIVLAVGYGVAEVIGIWEELV